MFDDLELTNASYDQLNALRDQLDEYVQLDMPEDIDDDHILLLFDLCERLLLYSCIQRLHNIIVQRGIELTARLEAAKCFCIDVPINDVLIERFDYICQYIERAINEEEDSNKKAIATFANYYLTVLERHPQWIQMLHKKIRQANYPFLCTPEISTLLSFNVVDPSSCYEQILQWKDALLGRIGCANVLIDNNNANKVQIETGSYANKIRGLSEPSFHAIRSIALIETSFDEYLMSRGVDPITSARDLFLYIKCFGQMHYAKIQSAIPYITPKVFDKEYELIDWGCGQGIGSMTFIEYCKEHHLNLPCRVTLIEPSELALSRAILHISVLTNNVEFRAICYDFDNLHASQIVTDDNRIKVHIFSNVLDIELYNIHKLEHIIQSSQSGINYFLCVSPNINAQKNARIRAFENSFSTLLGYTHIVDIVNCRGEWENNWTRVLRVFKYGK